MAQSSMYEILELSSDATLEDIKLAYRRLAPQVHPDQGGSQALFRLVQEAYETLTGDLVHGDSAPVSDAPERQTMSALGVGGRPKRDERAKWVQALIAQERALAPRICITV